MIRNREILEEFERKLIGRSKSGFRQNLKIVEELYWLARKLRQFPPKNKLEGVDTDIKIAEVLNSVR